MRRKQLFAIILAGALAAGSAPAAVFAAESDMAAMSEEGVGNAGSEEAGSEDGSSDAEAPVTDGFLCFRIRWRRTGRKGTAAKRQAPDPGTWTVLQYHTPRYL